jgi:hypothetical protein
MMTKHPLKLCSGNRPLSLLPLCALAAFLSRPPGYLIERMGMSSPALAGEGIGPDLRAQIPPRGLRGYVLRGCFQQIGSCGG